MRAKKISGYAVLVSAIFVLLLLLVSGSLKLSANNRAIRPSNIELCIIEPCERLTQCAPSPDAVFPAVLRLAADDGAASAQIIYTNGQHIADVDPAVANDPAYKPGFTVDSLKLHTDAAEGVDSGKYNFAMPVPESEARDNSYFEDALFIGDSRTVGMMAYSGVKSTYYAKVALTIRGVLSNPFIESVQSVAAVEGETPLLTVMDAITANPVYKKVYISFGLNEAGWGDTVFINTYRHVIQQLKGLMPDALIYIEGILPVSKATSDENRSGLNNETLSRYNTQLAKLAKEEKIYYLAINEAFTGEDGSLTENSADGIHLGASSVKRQFEYLRAHTVRLEDYEW